MAMNEQLKDAILNCKIRIAQLCIVIFIISPCAVYSQMVPGIQWQEVLGGTHDDWASSILQTSDGGYIAVGGTYSSDGDFIDNHGKDGVRGVEGIDAWIAKFDSLGIIEWQKCLGGSGDEAFSCIIHTRDGGYIASGYTTSFDGDVKGQHGGVSPSIEYPCSDAWIVKLTNSGIIEWQKCIGGEYSEYATSIIENSGKEGGYTFVGYTTSFDGDVMGFHSGIYPDYFSDVWIVHLDSSGRIKWQKCLGGTDQDYGHSIVEDYDHGYVIAGSTTSSDGDVVGFHAKSYKNPDGWVVKTNDTGKIIWQKCLGGSGYTELYSLIKTVDGGFAVAGTTNCIDGDVAGNHGNSDAWFVKLTSLGAIQWQKCLGGINAEEISSIIQTPDSGYAVAGFTRSTDEYIAGNHGGSDAWIIKLSSSGNIQWQKCLGGTGDDGAFSIVKTSDGGFAIAGSSNSHDGDLLGQHQDSSGKNAWVFKLSGSSNSETIPVSEANNPSFNIYPNPANSQVTIHSNSNGRFSKPEFFDMLGRKFQCQFEIIDDHNISIHIDKLPSGNYFMYVNQDGKKNQIPFIVQH